ncbi:MAG TPA: metalloregulator ArsR/SmtB family transcription factor [Candidatus Dormibacteraeota bacterium]|nr:metalloregulator ArsR/SmtB family transcription factor [Candidatus Dormibacteraeota bacterium]
MSAAPVLDLTARRRALAVDIDVSPAYELIVSLFGWSSPDSRSILEIGPGWFDERRKLASPELGALLDGFADTGKLLVDLVGKLHQAATVRDVSSLLALLEGLDPEELWSTLLGGHQSGRDSAVGPDQIRTAAGDAAARRQLAAIIGADEECGGAGLARVARMEPDEVKARVIELLRRWHDEILSEHLATAAPILERDARAKQTLAAAMTPGRLIETATNGVSYEPEPGIARVLLIPHMVMRPWVVISEYDRTKIFVYPVAAESMAVAPEDPPLRLVALGKALGEEQRLRIIHRLAAGPLSLQQIADHLGLAKSTAHHHMVILRAAGLVRVELGGDKEYSLRDDPATHVAEVLQAYLGGTPR